MDSSSTDVRQQAINEMVPGNLPDWLEYFLGNTFFKKCEVHNIQKNDVNRYCVTCSRSICKFCVIFENHEEHELLTIYRHVYQDVVPQSEMERHLDCSKIQPYRCNKKWVVSLTPLPHNGSGFLIEGNGACIICKRKLTDPSRFRFCSIACKFEDVTGSRIESQYHGASCSQPIEDVEPMKKECPTKRRRKGVPQRAPLS